MLQGVGALKNTVARPLMCLLGDCAVDAPKRSLYVYLFLYVFVASMFLFPGPPLSFLYK